jgi:glycosyltransferase involved in cell wall biosynthesis
MPAPPRPSLLVITPRFPAPPIGGDRLRIFSIIEHLAADFDVDVFSLYQREADLADLARLQQICREVRVHRLSRATRLLAIMSGWVRGLPLQVAMYYTAGAARAVRRFSAERGHAAVLAHLVRTAEYTRGYPSSQVVVELTDAISMNYFRIGRPRTLLELVYLVERRRLAAYETETVRRVGRSVVVAEPDRRFLIDRGADRQSLSVITNGTDVRAPVGVAVEPGLVAFLGNLRTAPNRDMVMRFTERIFPSVLQQVPHARLLIIGANPPAEIRRLHDGDRIVVTGEVPDSARVLAAARVSVCPMRFGAGVQNKILESMAVGVPVVTTAAGLEGIDAAPGSEVLVAADDEAFADMVAEVLRDDRRHGALAAAGMQFVERGFRWDRPMADYRTLVAAAARGDRGSDGGGGRDGSGGTSP